jgi:hypothetical protein
VIHFSTPVEVAHAAATLFTEAVSKTSLLPAGSAGHSRHRHSVAKTPSGTKYRRMFIRQCQPLRSRRSRTLGVGVVSETIFSELSRRKRMSMGRLAFRCSSLMRQVEAMNAGAGIPLTA